MEAEVLIKKIKTMPPSIIDEVNDFLDFLVAKKLKKNKPKTGFGSAKGKIKMLPGFDDPLEEFADYI